MKFRARRINTKADPGSKISPASFDVARSDIAAYVVATNISTVVALLSGFATRSLLGPEIYGAYFLATSIAGYLAVLNTPLNTLVDIEVPLIVGREGLARIQQILAGAYGLLAWMLAIEMLVLGGGGVLFTSTALAHAAFVTVAIALPFDFLSQIDRLLLKGFGHFRSLLVLSCWQSLFQVVLLIGLTVALGQSGFFLAIILVAVFRCLSQRRVLAREVPFRWNLHHFWPAISPIIGRSSGAITLYKMSTLGMESIDRIFVARAMGVTALGVYSVSVAVASVVRPVCRSVAGGILPSYLRMRGKGHDLEVQSSTIRMNRAIVWLTCALVLVAMIGLELLISPLLPAFREAVIPGEILLIGEVFQQARLAPLGFILGSPSRRPLVVASGVGLVAAGLGAAVAASRGSLAEVAGASVVAYLLSYVVMLLGSGLRQRTRMLTHALMAVTIVSVPVAVRPLLGGRLVVLYCAVGAVASGAMFCRTAGIQIRSLLREIRQLVRGRDH